MPSHGTCSPSSASSACCRCRIRRSSAAAASRRWSTCRCSRNWLAGGRRSRSAPACTCCPAAVADFGTAEQQADASCPRCSAARRSVRTACRSRTPAPTPGRCGPGRSGDGDEYVISGDKAWITHGPVADFMLVAARTGDDRHARGISTFLVPGDAPGVSAGAPERKMGFRGSPTSRCTSTTVRVGADRRIGDEGQGFRIAMAALDSGRLGHLGLRGRAGPGRAGRGRRLRRAADRLRPDRSTSSRAFRSCWRMPRRRSPRPGSSTCTRPGARTPASSSPPRRRWRN